MQLAEATVVSILLPAMLIFVFLGIYDDGFIAGGRYGVGGRLLLQQEEPILFCAAIGVIGALSAAGLWCGLA